MTDLEIRNAQFPQAIPNHLAVGDHVHLYLVGRIYKVEDEVVDVTHFGGKPDTRPGQRTTTIAITDISHEDRS